MFWWKTLACWLVAVVAALGLAGSVAGLLGVTIALVAGGLGFVGALMWVEYDDARESAASR